jgi:capsular polysaccharide biosynthesis protein
MTTELDHIDAVAPEADAELPAAPAAARASRSALAPAATPPRGRMPNPLLSVRSHRLVALTVMLLVLALGVPAALVLGRHTYYTEAAVFISPRFVKNLSSDKDLELQSNSQYREFVQQQVKTINRYDIVLEALKRMGDKRYLWQKPTDTDRSAAERLAGNLDIKPVADTYLVTVGLEDKEKKGLAEIVNAVVETYVGIQRQEEFFQNDERIARLKEERKKAADSIAATQAARAAFAQELGVTTFSEGFLNPYDQLLVNSREALNTARRSRIEAESQIAALEKNQGQDGDAASAFAKDVADHDAGIASLKANLNIRRSTLLTKLSGMTPEHPGRPAIEKELSDIDSETDRLSGKAEDSARKVLLTQKRSVLLQAQQTEARLNTELEAQAGLAKNFASKYNAALALAADLARAQQRLNEIDDRISFLAFEASAPGFVHVTTKAREPLAPNKSGHRKFGIIFAILSLALGVIIPVGIDLIDPRVHAANELEKLAGFPPLGVIPARLDPQTRDLANVQLMRLATNLERERRERGSRVVLFTAARFGEGTTTTVLDVARALGSLGVAAVAVESNFNVPDERYRDAQNRRGFAQLWERGSRLNGSVAPATDDLPARLAVSNTAAPTAAGTIIQTSCALNKLRKKYELILIDAPPVALSAETEMLVSLADITLLVVQAGGANRVEIKRTLKQLERIAPPVIGSVLTRVTLERGGPELASSVARQNGVAAPPTRSRIARSLWK